MYDTSSLPAATELRKMRYKIPANLVCEKCTMQFYWSTGNTCFYDADYFTYFRNMKAAGWSAEQWAPHVFASWANAENTVCMGALKQTFTEEFWNCADIKIIQGSQDVPGAVPTPNPTSTLPVQSPTPLPTAPPVQPISTEPEPEPEPETESDAEPEPETEPSSDPADAPAGDAATASCQSHCQPNPGSWASKCNWQDCEGCSDCDAILQSCPNRLWGTCGGRGWTGPTCCQDGTVCQVQNEYYSQCVEPSSLLQTPLRTRKGLKIHRIADQALLQDGSWLTKVHDDSDEL